MTKTTETGTTQRLLAYMSTMNINILHLRNPWVTAWWSAAFPGFGHLQLGLHVKGFILILWEVLINVHSRINEAMVLSFTGRFKEAQQVINHKWVLLYIAVYVYAIWDSYRTTVEQNKLYVMADRENCRVGFYQLSSVVMKYLDRRIPWLALVWSLLMPGLGQLYLHRIPNGFFLLAGWIVLSYYSNFMDGLLTAAMGDWSSIPSLDPQWALFMPSIYCFAAFDAYIYSVEYNKLFARVQRSWLVDHYQQLTPILGSGLARRD
ncbi:hypothetical protein [Paenibacillus sp. YYML68]|uniref:hypothetical protein n=1 Tax=Paenibacillus sp. YYML68 TaxID=2909250 RepID=UPI00248FB3B1|nr:hypothetical protein [Paenibacillus sp. YYML68]